MQTHTHTHIYIYMYTPFTHAGHRDYHRTTAAKWLAAFGMQLHFFSPESSDKLKLPFRVAEGLSLSASIGFWGSGVANFDRAWTPGFVWRDLVFSCITRAFVTTDLVLFMTTPHTTNCFPAAQAACLHSNIPSQKPTMIVTLSQRHDVSKSLQTSVSED